MQILSSQKSTLVVSDLSFLGEGSHFNTFRAKDGEEVYKFTKRATTEEKAKEHAARLRAEQAHLVSNLGSVVLKSEIYPMSYGNNWVVVQRQPYFTGVRIGELLENNPESPELDEVVAVYAAARKMWHATGNIPDLWGREREWSDPIWSPNLLFAEATGGRSLKLIDTLYSRWQRNNRVTRFLYNSIQASKLQSATKLLQGRVQ